MNWNIYKSIPRLVRGNKVLDAGCGSGSLIAYLKGKELTGLDINFKALQEAKNKGYKELSITELHQTHFKDNKFDTVVCLEVLQYLEEEIQSKAIEELKRITKKRLIVAVPNYNCIGIRSILDSKLRDSFYGSINRTYYPTTKNTLIHFGFKKFKYASCRFGFIRNLFGNLFASEVIGVLDK